MRRRLSDYGLFLQEFRRTFQTTGAILPSSPSLARALARFVSAGAALPDTAVARGIRPGPRRILEVGPGTGAVTAQIVARLAGQDRLELVELNERFVARLQERFAEEPRWAAVASRTTIHHARVQDLPAQRQYDVIISGLPLNNFSVELVETILSAFRQLLAPGGTLSFFEYMAVRPLRASISRAAERERLRGLSEVLGTLFREHEFSRQAVFANFPPAWVHHLQFAGANRPGATAENGLAAGGPTAVRS